MNITIYQVDAFTDQPFRGNPAGVCVRDTELDEPAMQSIANEMNLAETAFVTPGENDEWNLRWFTPLTEVDLCGHATLASAHTLFEKGMVAPDVTIRFQTKSGELRVSRKEGRVLEMVFPAEPADKGFPQELIENAIQTTCEFHGANRMDAIAEVESEEVLRELKPDMSAIAALPVRGLIVTAVAEDANLDFVSRFFAPQCGVPEDPVTGSAHCCLAPYWAAKLDKTRLKGRQISARGGNVDVEIAGDRVILRGEAVTVMTAEMTF